MIKILISNFKFGISIIAAKYFKVNSTRAGVTIIVN